MNPVWCWSMSLGFLASQTQRLFFQVPDTKNCGELRAHHLGGFQRPPTQPEANIPLSEMRPCFLGNGDNDQAICPMTQFPITAAKQTPEKLENIPFPQKEKKTSSEGRWEKQGIPSGFAALPTGALGLFSGSSQPHDHSEGICRGRTSKYLTKVLSANERA